MVQLTPRLPRCTRLHLVLEMRKNLPPSVIRNAVVHVDLRIEDLLQVEAVQFCEKLVRPESLSLCQPTAFIARDHSGR